MLEQREIDVDATRKKRIAAVGSAGRTYGRKGTPLWLVSLGVVAA